jgi:hypothetical protein
MTAQPGTYALVREFRQPGPMRIGRGGADPTRIRVLPKTRLTFTHLKQETPIYQTHEQTPFPPFFSE